MTFLAFLFFVGFFQTSMMENLICTNCHWELTEVHLVSVLQLSSQNMVFIRDKMDNITLDLQISIFSELPVRCDQISFSSGASADGGHVMWWKAPEMSDCGVSKAENQMKQEPSCGSLTAADSWIINK